MDSWIRRPRYLSAEQQRDNPFKDAYHRHNLVISGMMPWTLVPADLGALTPSLALPLAGQKAAASFSRGH